MSILTSPNLLFGVRLTQFLFSLGFLVLIAWSNENSGYWTNLTGTIALGVITVLFTWGVTCHALWAYVKRPVISSSKAIAIGRITFELILMLMWIGSATLMLRPQTIDFTKPAIPPPPFVEWDLGVAFTFVEIVTFFVTAGLLFLEWRKSTKGGTSVGYV